MRETLDTLIQRVDEDRWLAARFSPAHVRERLLAIYAVNYEIARTAETVREGRLGAIRLQWWREALAEIAEGAPPRAHPALAALRRTTNSRTAADLQDIVNARAADFESQPFAAWCDVDRYLDGTAGVLLRVSAEQTEAQPAPSPAFLRAAGRAWGYTGLLRAAAFWRARGRSALPQAGGDFAEMREKAWAFYEEARRFARVLPQEVFPAIGYVALVPSYLKAIERGGIERPWLFRQLRLIAASASGKI